MKTSTIAAISVGTILTGLLGMCTRFQLDPFRHSYIFDNFLALKLEC